MLLSIQRRFCRRVGGVLVLVLVASMMAANPAAAFREKRIVVDRHGAGRRVVHQNWQAPVRHARSRVVPVHHRPHVGAILAALPLGFLTLALGSMIYYQHANAYYRQVPAGYMALEAPREAVVSEAPASAPPAAIYAQRVAVTAPRLNLRDGPGKGFEVLSVVVQGTSLEVRGSAPDWLYVHLDDGRDGWVQRIHTTPLLPPANG